MSSRAEHAAGAAAPGIWRKRLERRILRHLRGLKPDEAINQRQLALRLGELTSTVHYAVARLAGRGYVEYVSAPGRAKPIRLCPDRMLAAGLAVDKGYLRLTLLNLREEVVAECTLPQPNEPGLSLSRFAERIEGMLQQALGPGPQPAGRQDDKTASPRRGASRPLSLENLSAICVAVNGLVDPATGMVIEYSTFGWRDVPLAAALANRLGCPVTVIGTASLAEALSEAMAGVGRGYESMVYFRVGDGISARFVQRGQVLTGAFGYGGELGHVPVAGVSAGGACGVCGSPHCLEANASGPALAAEYAKRSAKTASRMSPSEMFAALVADAQAGQRTARKVIQRAMDLWTVGVLVSLNAYDPAVLALGGWCLRSHPELANQLAQRVRQEMFEGSRRPVHVAPAIVEPARRDLAAACQALQTVLGDGDNAG